MTRKELEAMGLSAEQVDSVIKLHGDGIEAEKLKTTKAIEERDNAIAERDAANTTLKSFDGIDVKDIQEKLKQYEIDAETLKKQHAAELSRRDRKAETDKFLSGLKFVNDETREYYTMKLETELDSETSKGKSRQEILDGFTKNEKGEHKPNIFATEDNSPHKMSANIPAAGGVQAVQTFNNLTANTQALNAHRLIK